MTKEQCAYENPAVQRCLQAYKSAYDKKFATLGEDEDEYQAEREGKQAYLCAMPPLSGYGNICDFIACIMYAQIIDIATPGTLNRYLSGAKVALSALRQRPKRQHHQRDNMGKRSKSNKIQSRGTAAPK